MRIMNRIGAAQAADALIRIAQDEAFAGSGHPELVEWHRERLAAARERVIRHLIADPRPVRMPAKPDVEYDR